MKAALTFLLVITVLVACSTSPTGRKQLLLFPESEMAVLGATAFDDLKSNSKVATDPAVNRYVQCISDAMLATMTSRDGRGWEVVVFEDDSANAFALPGRKIGVHTGILKVAQTADQLAAVIGHEIGHVQARHGGERMSVQFASATGQQLVGAMIGGGQQGQAVMAALGLGAQYGVVLPYGRTQESEADEIGVELMARAGFNPEASLQLWQNMAGDSRQQPPEFLSTHPSHQTRMRDLQAMMPTAMPLYEQARAQGRRPNCRM